MGIADFLFAFVSVVTSKADPGQPLQATLSGGATADPDAVESDSTGEQSEDAPIYGALGVLSRPLDPSTVDGLPARAEAVAARLGEQLVPLAWRDRRLNRFFPAGFPKGRIALTGYGGGFHTIDLTDANNGDQPTSIHTIYAPYAFAGGVPSKAIAVTLDTTPGAEHLTMSIGGGDQGYQVTMNVEDGVQVRTPNANTLFNIREDEIVLLAKTIRLNGNVFMGAETRIPGSCVPIFTSAFIPPIINPTTGSPIACQSVYVSVM